MNRVVFVIEQLYGGGAERVTAELANAICGIEGYEVHIILFASNPSKEYALDGRILKHYVNVESGSKLKRIVKKCCAIRSIINEVSPSYVISLAMTKTIGILTAALIGKKVPVFLSERNSPDRYKHNILLRCIRCIAFYKSDGIVFQTSMARDYFFKCIREKSVVIYNPIKSSLPDVFSGIRSNVIVNFCSLSKQKNLDLLIESFNMIKDEFPKYKIYIYGDGPERKHLENKIRDLNLDQRVFLPGYVVNVHEKIKKAKLFVSSSDYEGMSNSMLEAISLGIPTICTNCPTGGAEEIINNRVNGILVSPNQKEEMANAMRFMLKNEELAQAMAEEGYKIRKKLDASTIALQWIEFIERRIIEGK